MHPENRIEPPVTLTVHPMADWNLVATGLEPAKDHAYTYAAANFDELCDFPILVGKLKTFPSFKVQGKLLRFSILNDWLR